MKKIKKTIVGICICILLLSCVYVFELNICKLTYVNNKKEAQEIMEKAYNIIESKNDKKDVYTELSKSNENDIIGILVIKKIDVKAPVKQGTSQQIMQTSVGHFTESDLWDGNVSLASHNSGTSMHYFEKINKLDVNDEIIYITSLGERKYKVQYVSKIKDTDWSMVKKNENTQNKENTITLITCINGQPDYRLCVRGIQI